MPDDDPTTPPRRGEGGVPTRELLFNTVLRIRQDLARVQRLAAVIGINQEIPPAVTAAIQTLQDWSAEVLRAGRPRRPKP